MDEEENEKALTIKTPIPRPELYLTTKPIVPNLYDSLPDLTSWGLIQSVTVSLPGSNMIFEKHIPLRTISPRAVCNRKHEPDEEEQKGKDK